MASMDVKLPELGEGVTEGELVKWLVKPGDTVKADQAVAEVMTDKATVEVPSPVAGVVQELKFKVGQIIKVESTILSLDRADGGAAKASPGHSASTPAGAPPQTAGHPVSKPSGNGSASIPMGGNLHSAVASGGNAAPTVGFSPPVADSRVLATPSTRRLAREMNVDVNGLSGSGLAGRVTREDVVAAAGGGGGLDLVQTTTSVDFRRPSPAALPAGPGAEERIPMVGIRRKIAENMQKSKSIIPHFTLMDEATVDALVELRASLKEVSEQTKVKITYLPFVIKAALATLREFPMFNASIDDAKSEIVVRKYFNIGFAADTPNGLVVPVIHRADQKTILQIAAEIQDLSKRAKENKLKPDEMKHATFTVTNIGSIGGTYATPVINHPEVAILGMYKIHDQPVFADGTWKARKAMNFTITCDHRLIDGAVAARFLQSFLSKVSHPGRLILDMM